MTATKPRRYFTRDPVWAGGALIALGWVCGLLIGLLGEADAQPEYWLAFGLFTLAGALALRRIMKWGVYVGDEGIRVVNFFSSSPLIPWEDIREFRLDRGAFVGIAALLEHTDGSLTWCSAIQHRWLSSIDRAHRKAAGRAVAALNAELSARRSGV